MKFDAYAFLAKLEAEGGSGEAAPPPPKMEPARRVAHVARVARPLPENPKIEPKAAKPADPPQPAPEAFPYGVGVTGTPSTWTGRVVSLDDWRRLSDWDRHGSTGKIWNGLTRQWEPKNGGTT